ncbi:unnamed protein product [Ectocarpus sp. 12 AP-2014]
MCVRIERSSLVSGDALTTTPAFSKGQLIFVHQSLERGSFWYLCCPCGGMIGRIFLNGFYLMLIEAGTASLWALDIRVDGQRGKGWLNPFRHMLRHAPQNKCTK